RAGAVERDTDDPALLGQRLENGLADPPDRIGYELDPLGLVEFVGSADQAEVALVDEVAKCDALVLVLLGYGDDEAEVGADELVERFLIADADGLGQLHLVLAVEQRVRADLLEVLIEGALIVHTLACRVEAHTALRR